MMVNAPKASLVITTYRNPIRLYDCLGSIARSTFELFETIVVNNGGSDTEELIEATLPDSRFKVVSGGQNLGFAGGNNFGFSQTRGDYICFLNDDVVVHPTWLEEAVSALKTHPDWGAVSSRVLLMRRYRTVNSKGQRFHPSLRPDNIGDGLHEVTDEGGSRQVFAASGPAMVARREMIEDLEGFDPDYFLYYEDVDLFWRAHLKGWDCWYVPSAVVYHYRNESTRRVPRQSVMYTARNRVLTLLRNYHGASLLGALPWIVFRDL